jgi:hypothetical protein
MGFAALNPSYALTYQGEKSGLCAGRGLKNAKIDVRNRFAGNSMMLLQQFQREIASLVIALLTTWILFLFRTRVELVWSSPHSWNFLITPPPPPEGEPPAPAFNVYTAAIFVQNRGRIPATDIELTFNWQPPNFNVWPLRPYETHRSPDGRFTIRLPNLAPKENFQVEMLGNGPLPALVTVRSKESVGKPRTMIPTLTDEKSIYYTRNTLIVLGMAAVVYLTIKFFSLLLQ